MTWFVHDSGAGGAKLPTNRVAKGQNFGAPLSNLAAAMKDAKIVNFELWIPGAESRTVQQASVIEYAAAALQAGKVDLISIAHKTDPQRYRISRIADLPLLGDFAETTSVAYQRIYEKAPLMVNEHKGDKVLAVFTQPPAFLFTSHSSAASASPVPTVRRLSTQCVLHSTQRPQVLPCRRVVAPQIFAPLPQRQSGTRIAKIATT